MDKTTMMERRKFLSAAAAFTVTASTMNACSTNNQGKNQMVHHVFFWLKNPGSTADRDKLIEGVKSLKDIETIRQIHIGVPASTEQRDVVDNSWHVSELLFFDNAADEKIYQDHPTHQAFVKNYSHLWSKVVVYDVLEV